MKTINTAIKNLRRSPYQSLSAFAMTTITFFVVTIFSLLVYSTSKLLTYFESRPQVTAFFKDTTTKESVDALQKKILDSGVSESMKYVSKEEALELYKNQNKDNPLLLEMVTADILPSSLEVSGKSVKNLEAIAQILKQDPGVEEVAYQSDVADTLRKWTDGVRVGGLVLTTILLAGSLITMVVILGMRVAARRSEIKTLSLLGASGWYIRAPFLSEGLMYALTGTIIGWGTSYLLILYLTPNMLEFFEGTKIFPLPFMFMLITLGGEMLIALLLGIIASLSATRRYGR